MRPFQTSDISQSSENTEPNDIRDLPVRNGKIRYIFQGKEGILRISKEFGIFSLKDVYCEDGESPPKLGSLVHFIFDSNIIGHKCGKTFHHIRRLWVKKRPQEFPQASQPDFAAELMNIFNGNIQHSLTVLEKAFANLINGRLWLVLNGNEGIIHISDRRYAWFHITNARDFTLSVDQLTFDQMLWFEECKLWTSGTEFESWSIAKNVWIAMPTKATIIALRSNNFLNLENLQDPSPLARQLQQAKYSKDASLFKRTLNLVSSRQFVAIGQAVDCSPNGQIVPNSSINAEMRKDSSSNLISKMRVLSVNSESHAGINETQPSPLSLYISSTSPSFNGGKNSSLDSSVANNHVATVKNKTIIGTFTAQYAREICPNEGVMVHGSYLVWIHSSHFYGECKRPDDFIRYKAELVWESKDYVKYPYCLYEAKAVWASLSRTAPYSSHVSIRSSSISGISSISNKASPEIEVFFQDLCCNLIHLPKAWEFGLKWCKINSNGQRLLLKNSYYKPLLYPYRPDTLNDALILAKYLNIYSAPSTITGRTNSTLRRISGTEGFVVVNNCIIWISSTIFSAQISPINPEVIKYSAVLLWMPKTVKYRYKLYKAQALWLLGNATKKLLKVNLASGVQSQFAESIRKATSNSHFSPIRFDQQFQLICESMISMADGQRNHRAETSNRELSAFAASSVVSPDLFPFSESIEKTSADCNEAQLPMLENISVVSPVELETPSDGDNSTMAKSNSIHQAQTLHSIDPPSSSETNRKNIKIGLSSNVVKEISATQGVLLQGNAIIWIHESHFSGTSKKVNYIHYAIELLWEPKTIKYGFQLYQTKAVWIVGDSCPKPADLSNINVRNCVHSSISSAIDKALLLPSYQIDDAFVQLCNEMLALTKPWQFFEAFCCRSTAKEPKNDNTSIRLNDSINAVPTSEISTTKLISTNNGAGQSNQNILLHEDKTNNIINEISDTEGVVINNNSIIWIHSSHLSGEPSRPDPNLINYSAILLWEPKTCLYDYRLYQAKAVWFSGSAIPTTFSNVTVEHSGRSTVAESIHKALNSKDSRFRIDQQLQMICESLRWLQKPWTFLQRFPLIRIRYDPTDRLEASIGSNSGPPDSGVVDKNISQKPERLYRFCSAKIIRQISDTEGVIDINDDALIWIHSSSFSERLKNPGTFTIFDAVLLWEPCTISYKYCLYQARNVWFFGNSESTNTSKINIKDGFMGMSKLAQTIRSALNSKEHPACSPVDIDLQMKTVCDSLLLLNRPWAFVLKFYPIAKLTSTNTERVKKEPMSGSAAPPENLDMAEGRKTIESTTVPIVESSSTNLEIDKNGPIVNGTAAAAPKPASQFLIESGSSTEKVMAISSREGVLKRKKSIIWIHSSSLGGRKPKKNKPQMNYTAELLWEPKVIDYKYSLYKSTCVWFAGDRKPKAVTLTAVSFVDVSRSNVSELLLTALNSKQIPGNSANAVDEAFRLACDAMLQLRTPWSFSSNTETASGVMHIPQDIKILKLDNSLSQSIPASATSSNTNRHEGSTSNDHVAARSSLSSYNNHHIFMRVFDDPIEPRNNLTNDAETVCSPKNSTTEYYDAETNSSCDPASEFFNCDEDDFASDSDGENINNEIQLMAAIFSKVVAKKLRYNWTRSRKNHEDKDSI